MATSDDLLKVIRGNSANLGAFSGSGGGGGGGGRGITGASPRNYNPASGGIPGVTNPADTITGNLGNINNIINSITSSQSGALKNQYPSEYFGILGTLLNNTQKRAGGDISDLLPELQQNSAEAAVAGGVPGSGAFNTKLLRDMGLSRYNVEQQALKDLGTIQNEIPTVRPYDPGAIINALNDAQERADLYAAAPSPEAAYNRANAAANAGAGGPAKGWKSGGVSYAPTGGPSGWNSSFSAPSWAPIAPQFGSAMNPSGGTPGMGSAPYGSIDYSRGNVPGSFSNFDDNYFDVFDDSLWGNNGQDFGGSNGFQGGAPWDPGYGTDIFSNSSDFGSGFNDFMSTDTEPQYADFYDEGY